MRVLEARGKIYDYFHKSPEIIKNHNKFAAYYTAMYLIQDTGEALTYHRGQGFSQNPFQAYIEFWGVMQAVYIQQDAILELYRAVTGQKLNIACDSKWMKIRCMRNILAGHPSNQGETDRIKRTFLGRNFGDYQSIEFETWDEQMEQNFGASTSIDVGNEEVSQLLSHVHHGKLKLGDLIDAYDDEAAKHLESILSHLCNHWPMDK